MPLDTVTNWKEPPKPLIGAVRVPNSSNVFYNNEPLCEGWRLTTDINDLLLPAEDVIVGQTSKEILEALQERYPPPNEELTQVIEERYAYGTDKAVFTTFKLPLLTVVFKSWRVHTEEMERIQELVAVHGTCLIRREDRQRLLDTGRYSETKLICRKLNRDFYTIQVDEKKAAGRLRGQETRNKKYQAKTDHQKRLRDIRRTYDEMCYRVRQAVLEPFKELGLPYCSAPLTTAITVGERLVGKQFYRKVEGWDVFLSTWRGWDRALIKEALNPHEDTIQFLDAEVKAMVRRERKRKREEAKKQREAVSEPELTEVA